MEEIQEMYEVLMENYENLKREIRRCDKNLYDLWAAGGFIIDTNILSMYPSLDEVIDRLPDDDDDDDEN